MVVSRSMLLVAVAAVVLVALMMSSLRPHPVAVRHTPLAPTKVIPRAEQASSISDRANAELQAATEAAGR
jgi:hypothetical protein